MRRAGLLLFAAVTLSPTANAEGAKDMAYTRRVMHDYAKCVVRKRPKLASEAILADVDNGVLQQRYSQLIDPDCMGRVGGSITMSFSGDLYRYALADALINAEFATEGPKSLSDRLPLAHVPMPDQDALSARLATTRSKARKAELQEGFDSQAATAWSSRYGECIVRAEPENVRLWILTPPDIPEELSRINALRKAFSQCLLGGTLRFNRVVMRGLVALNYYRLAKATPVLTKP